MRLTVTLEHRFRTTPDGKLWSQTMFSHSFWQRYLEVFDHVNIIARVLPVGDVDSAWKPVDGKGVSYTPVPHYIGPQQYLHKARAVNRAVRRGLGRDDAVIMRVNSRLAVCLEPRLRREGRPYGVEVVNDPYDVFAPGSVHHPLRPFFRWLSPRQLRRLCANASAASYVTEKALQRLYPASAHAFTTHYSSIELPIGKISQNSRFFNVSQKRKRLINVGSMAQMYKAQDLLIDAVGICVREGLDLELTFVGDGRHRRELESRAENKGLGRRVRFLGQLSAGEAVLNALDKADLFVLPSHEEGLPRAMIEAMARGLPCIGSTVGGIPELLPPEDMVPPGDIKALATKIRDVISSPARMNRMSSRNLEKAGEYEEEVLAERRRRFYRALKERTETWLKTRNLQVVPGRGGSR